MYHYLQRLVRVWKFLRNPKTGQLPKQITWLAILYLISPLDLLPGLPIYSWIDDTLVLYLAFRLLEKLARRTSPAPDEFIDVEGKVH